MRELFFCYFLFAEFIHNRFTHLSNTLIYKACLSIFTHLSTVLYIIPSIPLYIFPYRYYTMYISKDINNN